MGNSRSRHQTSMAANSQIGQPPETSGPSPQRPSPSNGQGYGSSWYQSQQPPGNRWPPTYYHPHQQARPQRSQEAPPPARQVTQTATMRNAVNLRKGTLEVRPIVGDPTKLSISFLFDALAPCMITTYVLATEQPSRGCSLTTSKQSKGAPVLYDKGLGQGFPREESECCLIDLAIHSDDELTVLGKDKYPLVIRLETITEQGMQEGHTLEELKPGGEQMPWVQSQTTFAALQRDEDDGNRYKIRILKQKVWINSSSYELQEIYGLQPGVSAKAVAISEDSEERLCVVCLVNEKDTTVLPCRHMCMCHECAQELRKQTSKCPICREQVESLLHIKLRKDKSARS